MADAIRYYVDYVFPVRRDLPVQPATRWGHNIGAQAGSTRQVFYQQ